MTDDDIEYDFDAEQLAPNCRGLLFQAPAVSE
jgi:hypothetical protein